MVVYCVLTRFKPNDLINTVFEITPDFLERRNLRGLLIDIDNTIVPHAVFKSTDEDIKKVQEWLEPLKAAGIGLRIVSNARPKRIQFHAEALGVKAVGSGGMAGKPFVAAFRTAVQELHLEPQQVAMLGDQVFTDVLGANTAGVHSILVRPVIDNALMHTVLARSLERAILKRFGFDW